MSTTWIAKQIIKLINPVCLQQSMGLREGEMDSYAWTHNPTVNLHKIRDRDSGK